MSDKVGMVTRAVEPAGYETARVLAEALPYIQHYDRETVVIKFGGHAMSDLKIGAQDPGDDPVTRAFARDMVLLRQVGVKPVVVHGGGPQIGSLLKRLEIQSEFREGLRVTDLATMEIVEMVLVGSINTALVRAINAAGGRAVGLNGGDGGLMTARKLTRQVRDPDSNIERVVDWDLVGEPETVNATVIRSLIDPDEDDDVDFIPVIAPVGVSADHKRRYNINADTAAGAIAGGLGAKRFFLLTDVPGVLDQNKQLIQRMNQSQARALITEGVATGGMIPKLETAVEALDRGVEGVVILDGRKSHSLLVEMFTEHGAGTLITRD